MIRRENEKGSKGEQKICPKIPPFWEEKVGGKWGMGPTLFSFPIFFPLPFSLLTSRGKCSPLPPFPSPFSFLSHFPLKQAGPKSHSSSLLPPQSSSSNETSASADPKRWFLRELYTHKIVILKLNHLPSSRYL